MRFTERNPLVLGLVAAALLAAVTVVALTLQRADLTAGYTVAAEFVDANGLRTGDSVLVAGVRAGEVVDLDIDGDRVVASLTIEGTELPSATRAEIVLRTLVGRRVVELSTGDDFSELLDEGDVIPLARTRVATDIPEFGDVSEELLREVDSAALNTLVRSLTDVTRDQRDELALLVEGGTRLTRVVTDQEEQIRRLLRALRGVSETLAASDADLVAVIDDVGRVLDSLATRREDVRRLLRETNEASASAADLVADTRGQLDRILHEVHADLEVVSRHQVVLAEALAYAPQAVGGFAEITRSSADLVPYGKVFVTGLGPAGVDVLLGCGGLLDQALDPLLGPDPRTCEEQTNRAFPRRDPGEQPTVLDQLPGAAGAPAPGPAGGGTGGGTGGHQTERQELDAVARRLLPEGVAP